MAVTAAAASAPSTPWWRVRKSSGRKPPRPGSGTPGVGVPTQASGLRSLQPFLPLPPPRIRSSPASVVSLATPSASRRSSPRMSIVPSWNLGMVAPPRVAVGGASDRLCVAAIVPFPRIRPVAISDSGTMAAPSRPTVKPDGPFAYTNVYDVIVTARPSTEVRGPRITSGTSSTSCSSAACTACTSLLSTRGWNAACSTCSWRAPRDRCRSEACTNASCNRRRTPVPSRWPRRLLIVGYPTY
jgi:hypothetical protein